MQSKLKRDHNFDNISIHLNHYQTTTSLQHDLFDSVMSCHLQKPIVYNISGGYITVMCNVTLLKNYNILYSLKIFPKEI